jgi:hypothetical protein
MLQRCPALFSWLTVYTAVHDAHMHVEWRAANCADMLLVAVDVGRFWLHPDRFKTSLCNQGPNCDRPICFFAHKVRSTAAVAATLQHHQLSSAKGPQEFASALPPSAHKHVNKAPAEPVAQQHHAVMLLLTG